MRSIHRALGVSTILGGAVALAIALPSRDAGAADHVDSPAAIADSAADIADVYAWVDPDPAGPSRLNLVMTTVGTAFSDTVQYVFHVASGPTLGATNTRYSILCQFDAGGDIACWAGDDDDYVTGDASDPAGLESWEGQMRVFAGERNDPFFFNLSGFAEVLGIVKTEADAGNLNFDAALCPDLDQATSTALVTQLMTEPNGDPAADDFAPNSVGALVVSIDLDLVTTGGDILAVWGATYSE